MKIKLGTVKEDRTVYGNRFYIQIEDTQGTMHTDLRPIVDQRVCVIILPASELDMAISTYGSSEENAVGDV